MHKEETCKIKKSLNDLIYDFLLYINQFYFLGGNAGLGINGDTPT
jgi:hypothetical protein